MSNRLSSPDRVADRIGLAGDEERNGVASFDRGPLAVGPSRYLERPAPPNAFQKYVEAATGQMLPVFGSRFFLEAARPDFRIDNVPVSADYTVGPGDEIIVRVWGSVDADLRSTVDRDGRLSLPRIGSFTVTGTRASDLEAQLRHQIARLYNNFQLSVSLGQLRAVKVFVVGPARRPGVYTLPSQSTLLSAAAAAGGPGPTGSMRRIVLRRQGQVVSEVDMYEFLVQGDKSRDLQLAPGDTVVFQPVGPRVALTGALDRAAVYELTGAADSVRDLLRYAGGASVLANPRQVHLERIDAARQPAARSVEAFALDREGLDKPLRDGDLLTLLRISPSFANAVTLMGHVAQPLRYPYRAGMRIRDLIPDKDALISADFYRRKNLLVQNLKAEEGRARTGGPSEATDDVGAAAAAGAASASARRSPTRDDAEGRSARPVARLPPAPLFDELNWDYAVIERLNTRDLSTQLIPFNLGKAVLHDDPANNLELLPGDVVTIYSQKQLRVPVARQTRLVTIEGEVVTPGVYQLLPDESLKQLVTRAGGFTPLAYAYGLEFTREETRKRQQANLSAAMARLQTLSATQSARTTANQREDAFALGAAKVSESATQAQIARLSRVVPTGRIALELKAQDTDAQALPDLTLEHSDRIIVPARPGFVTVTGAVINSNAYVWTSGGTVGDYLRLAGVDEAADTSAMFILQANGEVNSAVDASGFGGRARALESVAMQPGDALVVPSQLDYETWGRTTVRSLKEMSQIFSQYGIALVAIKSLRKTTAPTTPVP